MRLEYDISNRIFYENQNEQWIALSKSNWHTRHKSRWRERQKTDQLHQKKALATCKRVRLDKATMDVERPCKMQSIISEDERWKSSFGSLFLHFESL